MKSALKSHLTSNLVLKTISCILGYAFWCMLSTCHVSKRSVEIPLVFYGCNAQQQIQAPEKIKVELSGKRTDLQSLDVDALAVHIDAVSLHEGYNAINVENKSLLLPDAIKLVHYSPINIVVHLQENQSLT